MGTWQDPGGLVLLRMPCSAASPWAHRTSHVHCHPCSHFCGSFYPLPGSGFLTAAFLLPSVGWVMHPAPL